MARSTCASLSASCDVTTRVPIVAWTPSRFDWLSISTMYYFWWMPRICCSLWCFGSVSACLKCPFYWVWILLTHVGSADDVSIMLGACFIVHHVACQLHSFSCWIQVSLFIILDTRSHSGVCIAPIAVNWLHFREMDVGNRLQGRMAYVCACKCLTITVVCG